LPYKKNILEYLDILEKKLMQFIKESLKLLPNIDFSMLNV